MLDINLGTRFAKKPSLSERISKYLSPSFEPLSKHEAQNQIDRLLWAKGYKYTIDIATPPNDASDTPYDKIFVQMSAYNKVRRTRAGSELALPLDESTLYVSLDDKKNMTVSWLSDSSSQMQSKEFNLNTTLSHLKELLPAEGEEASNSTVLRDLCLACSLSTNKDNNILICSVRKPYELGEAKSGNKPNLVSFLITKKELNVGSIDNNFVLTEQNKQVILDQALELKYANEGLSKFQADEIIWPANYKEKDCTHFTKLLVYSLVLEIPYIYLQGTASSLGWDSLLRMVIYSTIIGYFGAGDDFFNNIFGVLTVNDAQYFVTLEKNVPDHLKSRHGYLTAANNCSFWFGGSGNSLGVLALMLEPLYKRSPIAFYVLGSLTVAFISETARAYYWAFNLKRYFQTLNAKAKKSDDFFANAAISIAAALVIVFRSIGFGGITVLVALAMHITNPWVLCALGIFATLVTAISIWSTRIQDIRNFWLDDQFEVLLPRDKELAWRKFGFNEISNAILTSSTLESVCMALGCLLPSEFKSNLSIFLTSAIGLNLIFIMIMAQLRRDIKLLALKTLKDNGHTLDELKERYLAHMKINETESPVHNNGETPVSIEMKNRVEPNKNEGQDIEKGSTANNGQLVDKDEGNTKIAAENNRSLASFIEWSKKITALCFERNSITESADEQAERITLAQHIQAKGSAADCIISEFMDIDYLKHHHVRWIELLSIPVIAAFIVAISVTSRGVGFLGYVDTINSILAPIITFTLNHFMQMMGLALIFAPANVRNMFCMFYGNLKGNVARKFVDRDMILLNENRDNLPPPSCMKWLFYSSPFGPSASRLSVAGIEYAVDEKIKEIETRMPKRK